MILLIGSIFLWLVLLAFPYLLVEIARNRIKKRKSSLKRGKEGLGRFFRIYSFALPIFLYTYWSNSPLKVWFFSLIGVDYTATWISFLVLIIGGLFLIISTLIAVVLPKYMGEVKISSFRPPFVRFTLLNSFFLLGVVFLNIVFDLIQNIVPLLANLGFLAPVLVMPITILLSVTLYLLFQQYFPGVLSYVFGFSPLKDPKMLEMFNNLSIRSGVKLKSLRILNGSSMRVANGWAYGLFSHNVCLTDSLLSRLTMDEVEAVLAHELGHVKQRHIWLNLSVISLTLLIFAFIEVGFTFILPDDAFFFTFLDGFSLVFFFGVIIAIGKLNEYRADRFSADVTGNPEALISALKKLTGGKRKKKGLSFLTDFLMIHPSFAKRRGALRKRGGDTPFIPSRLEKRLKRFPLFKKPFMVALSGGVDSCYLAEVASTVGGENFSSATVVTPYMFSDEIAFATRFAEENGFNHTLVEVGFPEILRNNPKLRCYHCKLHLMREVQAKGDELGFGQVMDGSNFDDFHQHRPGRDALRALGVVSPLAECGFSKKEIRYCSGERGLSCANNLANSCLLTRFPYDFEIVESELRLVESAERELGRLKLGVVRVRVLSRSAEFGGIVVDVELEPKKLARLSDKRKIKILEVVRKSGIENISISSVGYIPGRWE